MSERNDRARGYHEAIHHVLLGEWDPIGVADQPAAQDEYDGYIHEIHGLLMRHEPRHRLIDHLWWVETVHMGLAGNRARTEAVADRLMRVRDTIEGRADRAREGWLDRPAGRWGVAVVVAVVLAAPGWLMADELRYFTLGGDDFGYIADALDGATLRANLFRPHNTHVVPIFRLWTYALVVFAGRRANFPDVFLAASYLGLVATMLLVGRLAAREGGRTAVGLVAMAMLGVSTVVRPSVSWYSAGQALWAGAAVVVALLLVREWSEKGGGWRLCLVVLALLAAPAVWSGGLIAGPAAIAYLYVKDPGRFRRPALGLAAVSAGAVLAVTFLSRRQIQENPPVWERHPELWPRPIQSVFHTAQAIVEALVLGNLGLDAVTNHWQAIVLVLALGALWAWSRGGWRGVNPLEAAGATVVVGSYLLVYAFRGHFSWSSLRPLLWYHAIPQVGAVLFVAGWWRALWPTDPRGSSRLNRRELLLVLGLVGVLCVIQAPRAERELIAAAPPLTGSETRRFPIAGLQRLRAIYFRSEMQDRQLRAFARLDRADRVVARLGTGAGTLRRVFGRVLVPGIPENQIGTDVFSLLRLPADDPSALDDPARLHAALDELIRPEPRPRPPWLDPGDPWPP
ncbi:MAG: hypothetical protein NVSMB9_08160 [Isosphaeraceae bacterium]